MMERKPKLVADLKRVLEAQSAIHDQYLKFAIDERKAIRDNDRARVAELAAGRSELHEKITPLQAEMEKIAATLPNWRGSKLTKLVQMHCHAEDQKLILPVIERLKRASSAAKRASEELESLTQFSLGMTTALISLLWSGTQSVVRKYDSRGAVKESLVPSDARSSMTLRHA